MKCNVKELALMSDAPCVIEGRLNYKKISNGAIRDSVFKERWFRLVKNYLFYFRLSEMGKFDTSSPAGVFVLENSVIQMEHGQNIPFAFSISFLEEPEKRHILAARTQDTAVSWVLKLRECSYEYLRSQLHSLQSKIFAISGYDPLLLVPRNEGAKLWAPSVPFSTAPACSSSAGGFSCHLHSNGHHQPPTFTLDRSHSDALLAHRNRHCFSSHTHASSTHTHSSAHTHASHDHTDMNNKIKKTEIAVDTVGDVFGCSESNFSLERSVTTSVLPNRLNANLVALRPAPSPPVRKKSPRPQRVNGGSGESNSLVELSRSLATTSILDPVPTVPPRRKISPRDMCRPVQDESSTSCNNVEDLIKF